MIGLFKQLQPRAVVVFGCSFLTLAGMAGLVAWLGTVPPPDQVLHVTGRLDDLTVRDPETGAFTITLMAGDTFETFDLDNARALIARPSGVVTADGERIFRGMSVSLDYYMFGRAKTVVALTLGTTQIQNYDDVARVATEKVATNRNSAIGFGTFGALLILLGVFAYAAKRGPRTAVESDPDVTIGTLIWLALYGIALVVMLTEPTILHRAFGTEVLRVPIEYALAPALALVLLPLWPGCAGLGPLVRRAAFKGRTGKLGLLLELRSALASDDPAGRRIAVRTLWFLTYLGLLFIAWIFYAASLGI